MVFTKTQAVVGCGGMNFWHNVVFISIFLKGSTCRLFTEAMNAPSCEWNFHPDTDAQITYGQEKLVRDRLREEGFAE
ncbi:MAG: hypothetical protein GX907_04230 [Clostridiaceae bacterium]|nr:hypothetical protein [Clostridiaceae bacterium]